MVPYVSRLGGLQQRRVWHKMGKAMAAVDAEIRIEYATQHEVPNRWMTVIRAQQLKALLAAAGRHFQRRLRRQARRGAFDERLVQETLEHHLSDRSKQLSNCRFAYFLEITHLRNQLYIKGQDGQEFEAVEAYFFDPTEFLEEELRQQLNDKITLSVKVYHDQLVDA
ncbi:unnamed protein product, partial [Polarella glacialis]